MSEQTQGPRDPMEVCKMKRGGSCHLPERERTCRGRPGTAFPFMGMGCAPTTTEERQQFMPAGSLRVVPRSN